MEAIELSYDLDFYTKSTWLTVTAAPSLRVSLPYVQELGDFHCGPKYYTRRKNLPSYLIKYTVSGQGVLEYGREVYHLQPGGLFWIDCRKLQHYYTSRTEGKWHMLWVHFYGPTAKIYYDAFVEANAGSMVVHIEQNLLYAGLFQELMRLYENRVNSVGDDIQASGVLNRLMVSCIDECQLRRHANLDRNDYTASIRSYLDVNYQENISLDSLAQEFSINKYYLQKLFKKRLGLSPNEYLTRVRLEKAKTLLRTTDETMIQIAQDVGYTASYFDIVFKKYEGVTPHDYRLRWYDSKPLG